jgi:transglutaminase-like putative cysteine protease
VDDVSYARVWSLWRSAALLAVMVALAVAMGGLVSGAGWWSELMLASVVVLGVAAVARMLLPAALAPVLSFVALVLLTTALFTPQTAVLGLIPTPASFAEFGQLIERAQLSAYTQSVPADPLPEFLFLLVAAGGAIAWVCDLLAIVLDRAALVGIVVCVALIAPAALLGGGISPLALVLCFAAYLLLLRVEVRGRRGTGGEPATSLAIGAAAIVVALVIGTTAPGFQQIGRQAIPASGVVFGEGVSPLIDLGADLRRPNPVTVIDYSTTASSPGYLQMTTLDAINGEVWQHRHTQSTFFSTAASIDEVPGLSKRIKSRKVVTTVEVGNMTSRWLPAPYPVSRVSGLDGTWGWEQGDLTISGLTSVTTDQSYTITSRQLQPTAKQLRAAGENYPASVQYDLQLPANTPSVIRTTALAVTSGAATAYDKAVALQAYFHNGDFTYSLNAPKDDGYDGDTPGTIATFLKKKAGYCVHFAAAMVFMARELNIPARIAIGYLPGTQTGVSGKTSQYEVTSDNLHAWPELYFPGVGWVPFEPTVGRGTVPNYDTSTVVTPAETGTASPGASEGAQKRIPTDEAIGGPGSTTPSGGDFSSTSAAAAVVIVILALLFAPAVIRRRQRGIRLTKLRQGEGGASAAWAEVRASAIDLGLAAPLTETPRVFAGRLRTAWQDGQVDQDAADAESTALDELVDNVEQQRFGRPAFAWTDPVLADDVVTVVSALGAGAGLARRWRATLVPVSLVEPRPRLTPAGTAR